jgi:hypothetical protein
MNYFLPAAGIIPYIVLNETVFYLLGKEKSNKKWSGFIGNYHNNDLSIYNTAIREFNEETCLIYSEYIPSITKLVNNTEPIIVKKRNKNIYIFFIEFPVRFFENNNIIFFKNINILSLKEYKEKEKLGWFTKKMIIENENVLKSLKNIIKELNH